MCMFKHLKMDLKLLSPSHCCSAARSKRQVKQWEVLLYKYEAEEWEVVFKTVSYNL